MVKIETDRLVNIKLHLKWVNKFKILVQSQDNKNNMMKLKN